MKNNTMNHLLFGLMLLLSVPLSAQKYYPKLNNLFLENSGEESVFSSDLNYFREGLRVVNNKLFYGNMQSDGNSNTEFYSMKMIPRFVTEFDLLQSGVIVKFTATSKEEFPSFPVLYMGNLDNELKTGDGRIEFESGGPSLLFNSDVVTSLDEKGKKLGTAKAEFVIGRIEYVLSPDSLIVSLKGDFTTAVKTMKGTFRKNNFPGLLLTVKKEGFLFHLQTLKPKRKLSFSKKKCNVYTSLFCPHTSNLFFNTAWFF